MNLENLVMLAGTLLAVSACVDGRYGGGGHGSYYHGGGQGQYYGGGQGQHHGGEQGQYDYGRRVWHD